MFRGIWANILDMDHISDMSAMGICIVAWKQRRTNETTFINISSIGQVAPNRTLDGRGKDPDFETIFRRCLASLLLYLFMVHNVAISTTNSSVKQSNIRFPHIFSTTALWLLKIVYIP